MRLIWYGTKIFPITTENDSCFQGWPMIIFSSTCFNKRIHLALQLPHCSSNTGLSVLNHLAFLTFLGTQVAIERWVERSPWHNSGNKCSFKISLGCQPKNCCRSNPYVVRHYRAHFIYVFSQIIFWMLETHFNAIFMHKWLTIHILADIC
jgi:hypothetical protein